MASHSTSISALKVNINQNVVREERATESCTPLTLKQVKATNAGRPGQRE